MSNVDVERAAVSRIFQHPLMASRNEEAAFWDGRYLASIRLRRSLEAWTTGERALASLALNIWNDSEIRLDDNHNLNPCMWCANLDDSSMIVMLEALATRAGLLGPNQNLAIRSAR